MKDEKMHLLDGTVEIDLNSMADLSLFDLHNRVSGITMGITDLAVSHSIHEGGVSEESGALLLHFAELLELLKKINKELHRRWQKGYTEKEQAAQ